MLLYKYKGILNEETFHRDLEALEKNYFWCALLTTLNDPCEALHSTEKFFKQTNVLGSILGKKVKSNFIQVHEAFVNVIEVSKKAGIFSLSQKFDDELLWAHYGSSHKGYSIEYDLDILKESYGSNIYTFPVNYSKKPPEFDMRDVFDSKKGNFIKKLIGFKSRKWEYEKEYRIITDYYGKCFHNFRAVKGINFGLRMQDKDKDLIIEKLKGRGIKYYQIIQKAGSYNFDRELLIDNNYSDITYLNRFPISESFLELELVEKKYSHSHRRGDIKIILGERITEENILELSKYLKNQLFCDAEKIFIFFHQKSQTLSEIAWAHSQYRNGNWNVGINDFVLDTIVD